MCTQDIQITKWLCPKKPHYKMKSLHENLNALIHQMSNYLINLRHTLSTYITLPLSKITYYKACVIKNF